MKKLMGHFIMALALVSLFAPVSEAKKKSKLRKWSLSFVNGTTVWELRKIGATIGSDALGTDGQMNASFAYLEFARNFGYYELGGKIQVFRQTFVSPFIKLNFVKNTRKSRFIPFVSLGVVPSHLFGGYGKFGINLFVNRYVALTPFVGAFGWYKIKASATKYEKHSVHANGGVALSLYF